MTIIAIKKEEGKITISADRQSTTGQHINYRKKLFQVGNITIGGAGLTAESQMLERFLKDNGYDEKTIKNENELFNLFSNFYKYLQTKGIIDSREGREKAVFNNFFIIIQNLGKAYRFNHWALIEVEKYDAIGSGRSYAISVLSDTGDIKRAVGYAILYNIYCGGEIDTLEIKI